MPAPISTPPKWKPLPRMGYGIVTYPFRPLSDQQFTANLGQNGRPLSKRETGLVPFNPGKGVEIAAQQLSLDLGDEVYVFEQADGWYRGYVVTSVTPPVTLSTSSSSASHGPTMKIATEVKGLMEPKVYVGIFPANYVSVKEYVSDALGVLMNGEEDEDGYESGNASKRSSIMSATSSKHRRELSSQSVASVKPPFNTATTPNPPRTAPNRLSEKLQTPTRNLSNASRKSDKSRASKQANKSAISPGQRPPPLPALKVGDDTEAGFDEPLVDEISAALREWHGLLFGIFLSKKYMLFQDLSRLILKLERARCDLLSDLLTKSETVQLRREVVVMLNIGNKMLPGGAVIIRDPEIEDRGQIVDGEGSISPIALMAMQANIATTTPGPDSIDSMIPPTSPVKPFFAAEAATRPHPVLSHLFINMRAFVGSICSSAHEGVELMFALYVRHERHFISEFFLVELNHNGVPAGPRPEDLLGRIKTLFTDLTARDVADEVYLICRIFRIGEAKDVLRPETANSSTSSDKQSRASMLFDMARPGSSGRLHKSTSSIIRSKGSRVSQIFTRSTSPDGQNPPNPSLKNAQSVGNLSNVKTNGLSKGRSYRKPFGCAVLDLSKLLQETSVTVNPSDAGTEHVMPIFVPAQENDFHQLHEHIIESKTNKFSKHPRADSINVNFKVFHGDKADKVVQSNPTILHAVSRTNRIGFNDAPVRSRSDIFITIGKATNTGGILRSFTGPGYVSVSAEVRLSDHPETVVERCIFRGTGPEDGESTYESYIVGNPNDPLWEEKFKLSISEDVGGRALLVFKFNFVRPSNYVEDYTSEPDPPVAIAVLKLSTNGRFLRDGEHRMKIRRLEPMSSFDEQLAMYLQEDVVLPTISDAVMSLDTFLCSTRFTEDSTLHSLLKWKQDIGNLNTAEGKFRIKEILRKFTFVSEIEILKFLPEVFEALFSVLAEGGTRGELDDYVYRAIVYILGMEADRRFTNFKSKLEEYTSKRFNYPFINKSMFRAANRLLTNTADPKAAKRLRATMKVWRPLARFSVQARQQQHAKEVQMGLNTAHTETTFKEDIMGLFKLLQKMMRASQPGHIVGTQTLALQHFSSLLPELSTTFAAEELLEVAVGFVDSCVAPKGKLALYKLQLISNLVRNPVFTSNPSLERLLVFNVPRWLKPHCGKAPEFTEISMAEAENAKVLWREQIRLSTAVVAFALDYLWAFISDDDSDEELRSRGAEGFALLQPLMSDLQQSYLWVKELGNTGKPRGVTTPLFPTTYPFHTRPIMGGDKSLENLDELLAELSGVLMTSAMRAEFGKVAGLFGFRPTTNALSPLLIQSFDVYTSILSSEAFPSVWLNSHILVHKAIINHLATISEVMIQFYNPDPEEAESFDTPLWLAFFTLLLKTAGSEALAVEHLPPQKRRAVWRIAGDLRKRGAQLLQHSWAAIGWPTSEQETRGFQIDRMGGYQVQYVPSLVSPVVRLCLSHHEALRSVALEVLQTMIVSEYVLNEDLAILQNEIALDATFHHKPADADAMSKTLLVESLRMAFAAPGIDEELSAKVEELLNSVELFFELLVSAYGESHETDVELEHILKLMEFVKGMNRRDIYLKYIHQLARRHESNGFFVEAGLALKLEAELYQWDLETQLEESIEPEHPVQTHFARKESLYKRIIELFDKGKAWEKATELCKELAQQYETKTLDYLSLKNILLQQASFLDLILSVDRPAPSYFRVHCWGQAWPLAQRNKDWIVQGADWEKLSSFSERMQLLYPTAQLVNANTMPSFEAMEKGQYLQVVALVPIPDRNNPVFTIPGVSPRIRQYHEHHFVKQFSYQMISRKGSANRQDNAESKSDSVADVWTERRILYSEASFPNIARKANVANYATIRSSPIENAIQAIKSKNDELLELERKFEPLSYDEKEDINVNSLSLALTSIIDSPLNGGVHRYKEAFLSETNVKQQRENKEAMEFIRRLKDAIEDQVIIVRRCLEIHQNLVSKEMKPFHKSLVECISLMELANELVFNKNFAEELAVVRPATPRRRPSAVPKKRNASVKEVVDERTPVVASHPPIIPPINIETAPAPIPASVEHPGNMSRTSSSVSLSPDDDALRPSTDTSDRDSETPNTIRSQDRRSLTSRLTGASVKGLRKTLSFRGRKSGES